ncbi:transglutaminase domain-containing protein [Nocardioides sp. JQ2195]|uniref:transglutaminase-like domain-containing protein n=1 Tax=Nocardioides sp. JQ2195 TaxID=2592334 RepID=UPI00143EA978|nr:transglutaminase-like domain-containing protein [Nocardioides sp. JQ2195]QIX25405.1 transglutaminase domain-containing protein [Nocardioides sp. JQ2195]
MSSTSTGSRSRSVFTGGTVRRVAPWKLPAVRRAAGDVAATTLLLSLGAIGFGPVFGGAVGLVAAGGGVVLGVGIGVLGAWRRWSRLGTLLATMLGYLLLGGPFALPSTTVAGFLPTGETIRRLTLLSWQAWRDLLTVGLPAGQFDGPAVAPFLGALVTATVATSSVLRLRALRWVVLGGLLAPLVLLVVGILWGSHDAPFGALRGALFAAVALVWASWRTRRGDLRGHAIFSRSGPTARTPRIRQAVIGAVALAAAGGLAVTGLALLAPHPDRTVLRDHVVPPLELRDYASPLTLFRHLSATLEKETLFTVEGLPEGGRIRLATMDLYDGNVYSVSEGSAQFVHAGQEILPSEFSGSETPVDELTFRIVGYSGVWVPGGGDLRGVTFAGDDEEGLAAGLFFNPATGTALTTAGVGEGTTYTVDVARPSLSAAESKELPADLEPDRSFRMPENTARVDAVSNKVAEFVGDAVTPMEQLRQIESRFRQDGFFANGTDEGVPSYAGHTVTRISQLLESQSQQMIGDDEQYAVAFALMARDLDLPARVVMGFHPDTGTSGSAPLAITGDDAHVWVEVLFGDAGWVTFDPTPPEDQTPEVNTPEPNPRNEPQVLPPPEVPEEREPREPPPADSDVDRRDDDDSTVAVVLRWVAIGTGVLLLLLAPFLVVAALKSRRRQRRRNAPRLADRISGGWSEIIDLGADVGLSVPRQATRTEAAMILGDRIPTSSGTTMAHRVDGHVFGVTDPTSSDVDAVWEAVDGLREELHEGSGPWQRLRARFSIRSLR